MPDPSCSPHASNAILDATGVLKQPAVNVREGMACIKSQTRRQ